MTVNQRTLKKKKLRNAEYYDFQTVQDKLYKDSSLGKTFNGLVEIVSMPENIRLAYRNIKKNSGSKTAGTDGKTIADLEKLSDRELIKIVQNKLNWYQPQSVLRVEIPKGNDPTKKRPLGIPTILDRLIQQCVLQVMEPICEAKFHDHSYGFRPNRSQEHALAQAEKNMQNSNLHYVVDIDIKGFFDNVNHGKLLKQMWTMGFRDKKLISIISAMLKAEVAGIGFPEKGTPQGGIISPLLSNIVLNELDWWIASQWEAFPTHKNYKCEIHANGSVNRGNVYKMLRSTSNLKEMTCVRYADDFKIFTSNYKDALKIFEATKGWLKDRLGLDISPEKSKVVNLRENYSEFIGFKLKVIPRGKKSNGEPKYVVRSRVRDKSIETIKATLKREISDMKFPKGQNAEYVAISKYNACVMGIQNYYCMATMIGADMRPIAFQVQKSLRARFKERLLTAKQVKKKGIVCTTPTSIVQRYGMSMQMRYVDRIAVVPIGYVRHIPPHHKRKVVNSYTAEGREAIHNSLKKVDMSVLHELMRNPDNSQSIEFNDNRLSLFSAQYGKCAITGIELNSENLMCIRKSQSEGDKYSNLVIVCKEVASILKFDDDECAIEKLKTMNVTAKQVAKFLKLRSLMEN